MGYISVQPFFRGTPPSASLPETSAKTIQASDDQARFKRLVLPYLDDAYGLARWLTRNPTDAEDVVQDACLRAFHSVNDFAGVNARAWILAIVRNTAYSWLRKNRRSALVEVEDLDRVEGDLFIGVEVETPETALIAKDEAMRLSAAIAALPEPYRETLVLRENLDLSYREIAEVVGAPIGTVMSRLARARGHLLAQFRVSGLDAA
jgi:RNA polymerase sigma factor (sigma-70 family)